MPEAERSIPAQRADDGARDRELLDTARLTEHTVRLYRAAYALCGSTHDAEDLVQETYARVIRRPRFIRRDRDAAYLMRALRNTWISDSRRRHARALEADLDSHLEEIETSGTDPDVTALEVRAAYAAILQLSAPLREAIAAVDIVGLSYKQAAKALGVPEGTIMSRLYRARERVATALES